MFTSKCPCESGETYKNCCEPFHKGSDYPKTAEALMRSRYAAFAKGEVDYLEQTLLPKDRSSFDRETVEAWSKNSKWLGLEILNTKDGTPSDNSGSVEFIAHYKIDDEEKNHHELATFRKIENRWFFIDGKIRGNPTITRETPKVGRNDPCACGSGKKFKKCCGK